MNYRSQGPKGYFDTEKAAEEAHQNAHFFNGKRLGSVKKTIMYDDLGLDDD
jgi:hypothetical protein